MLTANKTLQATATGPGRWDGVVPGLVTPAAFAAVAPKPALGANEFHFLVAVPELGRWAKKPAELEYSEI